jgi:hypothetical protein
LIGLPSLIPGPGLKPPERSNGAKIWVSLSLCYNQESKNSSALILEEFLLISALWRDLTTYTVIVTVVYDDDKDEAGLKRVFFDVSS